MTSSKKTNNRYKGGGLNFIGTLVMLPVLLLSIIFYVYYYFRYIAGDSRQRVMDIRRMAAPLIKGAVLLGAAVLFVFFFLTGGEAALVSPNFFICLLGGIAIAVALHLTVIYVGVVGDPQNDRIIFPPDMQSYGFFDYLFLRFVVDYCRVDSTPLSAIKRITRGYGTELYLHGDFGSKGIFFSSKQKRDECMVMIQNLTNRHGLVFSEIESY